MESKLIGMVTEDEKNEIERLFERKNGLSELMLSLSSNALLDDDIKNAAYEKLVNDMGKTKLAFEKWWSNMQEKYKWENIKGYSYQIDFETNEIIIAKNDNQSCC